MTGFTVLSIFFHGFVVSDSPADGIAWSTTRTEICKTGKNALLNIDQKTYTLYKGVLNPGSGGFSFSLIPPLVLSKNAIALLKRAQI